MKPNRAIIGLGILLVSTFFIKGSVLGQSLGQSSLLKQEITANGNVQIVRTDTQSNGCVSNRVHSLTYQTPNRVPSMKT
jgi:hypothetical protein